MSGKRRIRPFLLVLLWIWAVCVFVTLDLFLNISHFDSVRPRGTLYEGMRRAGHEMVGEPYDSPNEGGLVVVVARAPVEEEDLPAPARSVDGTDAAMAASAVRHGSFTQWNDPPGQAEGEYRHGQRHGTWTWRWPDGSVRETREYADGKLHGTTASWYADGQREVVEGYEAGKPNGTWNSWYPGGQEASVQHYEKGVLHGDAAYWHPNGQLRVERRYEHGQPLGRVTVYHANGQKAEEGGFEEGRKAGVWTTWDERGIETGQVTHTEHGVRIDDR